MITDAQLEALLEHLVRYRTGKLADTWIAAFVLLAIDGIKPHDALAWTVADIVESATPTQWAIKRRVKIRKTHHVLTVRARAALTIYLARRIAAGEIRALNADPFFTVTKRTVQKAWEKTRERAKIGAVTFHDLRRRAEEPETRPKRPPALHVVQDTITAPAQARKRSR